MAHPGSMRSTCWVGALARQEQVPQRESWQKRGPPRAPARTSTATPTVRHGQRFRPVCVFVASRVPSAVGRLPHWEETMRPVIGRAATLSKNRQDDQYGPEPDADCLATHSGVTGHYEAVLCRPDANLRARSEVQLVQDVLDVCGYGPVG